MRLRVVVIATSTADGLAYLERHNLADRWRPLARRAEVVVTPRSPDRARGRTADRVKVTAAASQLPREQLDRLLTRTLPCIAWRAPRE